MFIDVELFCLLIAAYECAYECVSACLGLKVALRLVHAARLPCMDRSPAGWHGIHTCFVSHIALLPLLQAQVGVTPERARVERRRLAEQAEQAEAEAQAAKLRVQRLEAVLAFEVRCC